MSPRHSVWSDQQTRPDNEYEYYTCLRLTRFQGNNFLLWGFYEFSSTPVCTIVDDETLMCVDKVTLVFAQVCRSTWCGRTRTCSSWHVAEWLATISSVVSMPPAGRRLTSSSHTPSLRYSLSPVAVTPGLVSLTYVDITLCLWTDLQAFIGQYVNQCDVSTVCLRSCLVFKHLREHEGWPHHEPSIAIDICLPQLSTVVQLTTLSKMSNPAYDH